jgi:Secretion system C-terminal sorting domain/Metallo-peptidase family M12
MQKFLFNLRYFVALITLLASLPSYAQEEFMTPIITTKTALPAAASSFQSRALTKSIQYVKMGNFSKVQKNGTFTFTIPGVSKKLTATVSHVESQSTTNYNWFGNIENNLGNVIVLCRDGKITGQIILEGRVFEIYDINGVINALIEIDATKAKGKGCALDDKKNPTKDISSIQAAIISACQPLGGTRVLVLTTAAARQRDPNINQTVNLAVQQFNSAIVNSSIANTNAKLTLTNIRDLAFVETPNDIGLDINTRLINNADAQRMRNEDAADIVVLITNGQYGGGTIFGSVGDNAIATTNNNSYAIVDVDYASSIFTFAHEVGHLFGGRHQDDIRAATNQLAVYAHGYKFSYKTGWWIFGSTKNVRTIMHRNIDGYDRIPYFSNPNVSISGVATSDNANFSHVARRIGETANGIAAFRADKLTSAIAGQTTLTPFKSYTWDSNISCGSAPYTYQWAASSDGFSYFNTVTTSTYNATAYPSGGGFYRFLRLTVRSADGQISTAFLTTTVTGSSARIGVVNDVVSTEQTSIYNEITDDVSPIVTVYPNPTELAVSIDYVLLKDGVIKIDVINDNGLVVQSLGETNQKAGRFTKTFDVSSYNSGIYYIRLNTGNEVTTKKLIINK